MAHDNGAGEIEEYIEEVGGCSATAAKCQQSPAFGQMPLATEPVKRLGPRRWKLDACDCCGHPDILCNKPSSRPLRSPGDVVKVDESSRPFYCSGSAGNPYLPQYAASLASEDFMYLLAWPW